MEAVNPQGQFFHFIEGEHDDLVQMLELLAQYFHNKSEDNRAKSEAQLILKTKTIAGFLNEFSETSAKYWTITISMDHSLDGLRPIATY